MNASLILYIIYNEEKKPLVDHRVNDPGIAWGFCDAVVLH